MIHDPKRLIDGQITFERGVDGGRSPSRIGRNQLATLINGTCRDDGITTRPGWKQLSLSFADSDTGTGFKSGLFQRAFGYQARYGEPHLVVSVAGRLFRVNVASDRSVQEIPFDGENDPTLDRVWFEQGEEYLFWQDNEDIPLIYNGNTCVRSDVNGVSGLTEGSDPVPLKELPVGNVMAYANGRLTVALPDGRSFTIGDILGGPSGNGSPGNRSSIYHFTENQFLNEGRAFGVPAGVGKITAMKPLANQDTSLGQGPLQIFTQDAAFSVDPPVDRTTWLNNTYPIATVSLLGDGPASAEGVVQVNSDLWMRVGAGVQAFMAARRNFGTWTSAPLSHEARGYLEGDNPNFVQYASAIQFDSRLLVTVSPQLRAGHGVVFRGLVALDFTPVTAIGVREPPAWDGLWTGVNVLQLVSLTINHVVHVYAITLDSSEIGVWELTTNQRYDLLNNGSKRRITMAFETPRYDFGNRMERKLLEGVEIWVSNLGGVVDGTVFYRPDQDPCWHSWQVWQKCAPLDTCPDEATDNPTPPPAQCQLHLNKRSQWNPRLSLQRPPEADESGLNLYPSRLGYEHQMRWEITGSLTVESIRAHAQVVDETTYGDVPETVAECQQLNCCAPNELDLPLPVP